MRYVTSNGYTTEDLSVRAKALAHAAFGLALIAGCGGSASTAADSTDNAATAAAAIPEASGQVLRVLSANQNGRAITYRALVVRAGIAPERDLDLVIQKVVQSVSGSVVKNTVVDQLVIGPSELPGGADATMQVDQALTLEEDGFHFQFAGGASCSFAFDGSGAGTPTTREFFRCDFPGAGAAAASPPAFPVVDGVAFASGQVIRALSANQNGRAVTYRALVVRAGAEPEHNLRIVIQKVQASPSGAAVKNSLLDSLVIEPKDLPGGVEATMQADQPLTLEEAGFRFSFEGGASCSFEFDGSGTGSPTKREFFHCSAAARP